MEWIKVTDKMPPLAGYDDYSSIEVLCYNEKNHIWVAYFHYISFKWESNPAPDRYELDWVPTHWAILPGSPG